MQATLVPRRIPFPQGAAPRTPGVHLSGLLKSMAVEYGFLDKQWVDDLKLVEVEGSGEAWWNSLDDASQIRMALGLAWEQWYLPQVPGVLHQPGELEVEGIYMSRDGESLDVVMAERKQKHIVALHECKVTSKSINTVGDLNFFSAKNWLWTTQIACYCVAPSTKILTGDLEWKEAHSLPVGSNLFSFAEYPCPHGGRVWRRSSILVNQEIEKPCYEITLEDGTEVICSHDHKWLCKTDTSENSLVWVAADKLFPGDASPHMRQRKRPYRICKPLNAWETPTDYDSGWLAGMFDGEGCLTNSNGRLILGLSQKEGPTLERARQVLTSKGIRFTESATLERDVKTLHIRTQSGILECLGRIRPQRLLEKFRKAHLYSEAHLGGPKALRVVSRKDIGNQKVRLVETTSGTFLANGMAAHNCYAMQTAVAYLHVLYLYGDYTRPYRQVLHVWRLEFTETELATIWRRVRDYRDECAAKGVLS